MADFEYGDTKMYHITCWKKVCQITVEIYHNIFGGCKIEIYFSSK